MYIVVYGAILCCISSQLYSVGLEHFNSNALYLKINTQHFVAFFFFYDEIRRRFCSSVSPFEVTFSRSYSMIVLAFVSYGLNHS